MDRLGRAVWELLHAHPEIDYVRTEVYVDGSEADPEVLARTSPTGAPTDAARLGADEGVGDEARERLFDAMHKPLTTVDR